MLFFIMQKKFVYFVNVLSVNLYVIHSTFRFFCGNNRYTINNPFTSPLTDEIISAIFF
jgi:hypothetical protein